MSLTDATSVEELKHRTIPAAVAFSMNEPV
jgi:hypothetical protein